jgi:metal-responsive CopG/Arc/MetJ family transcriptional regulator
VPTPRKYKTSAERVAAYRARHALVTFTVDLPSDLVDDLNEYLRFKDMTKSVVIAKLIRSQLLRKR